jgi:hypothetical protein
MNEITLREYVDIKVSAIETSTRLAYNSMEKRLEGMNEFRNQLRDQNSTFITKAEYSAHMNKLEEDIRMLRESKALLEGKASQTSVNIALGISIVGLILTVLNIVKLIGAI